MTIKKMNRPMQITPWTLMLMMLFGAMVGAILTAGFYSDIALAKVKASCTDSNGPENVGRH